MPQEPGPNVRVSDEDEDLYHDDVVDEVPDEPTDFQGDPAAVGEEKPPEPEKSPLDEPAGDPERGQAA